MAGAAACVHEPDDAESICAAIRKHLAVPHIPTEAPQESIRAPERIAALRETELLDSPKSESFDALTSIATKLLNVPVALVSLVDEDRQFFKSQIGVPEPWASYRQTPLSHSFCQWVVSSKDELIVSDATQQVGLLTNLALRDLGVIAYAGVPLSADGQMIGSFCAIDSKPHEWAEGDLKTLRELCKVAEAFSALKKAKKLENQPENHWGPGYGSLVASLHSIATGASCAMAVLQRCGGHLEGPERQMLARIAQNLSQELAQSIGALK
jgi:hypothetical protein